jgi:nitrous oxidase accessory protein NosD
MIVPPTCVVGAADDVVVRDCHVESIALTGGRGHRVTGNVVAGGSISMLNTNGCEVRANYQHGLRWGVGIMIVGGSGHVIADNECRDDLCAIRLANVERARVDHNRIETRWWGIHLLDTSDCTVRSNRAWRTMRAVDVEGAGAHGNVVERQLAEHCDTGVLVERGAAGTRVADSWLHDCRVGLLVWEAGTVELANVAVSEPRDHAVVADTELDLAGVDLGGDVWIAP